MSGLTLDATDNRIDLGALLQARAKNILHGLTMNKKFMTNNDPFMADHDHNNIIEENLK